MTSQNLNNKTLQSTPRSDSIGHKRLFFNETEDEFEESKITIPPYLDDGFLSSQRQTFSNSQSWKQSQKFSTQGSFMSELNRQINSEKKKISQSQIPSKIASDKTIRNLANGLEQDHDEEDLEYDLDDSEDLDSQFSLTDFSEEELENIMNVDYQMMNLVNLIENEFDQVVYEEQIFQENILDDVGRLRSVLILFHRNTIEKALDDQDKFDLDSYRILIQNPQTLRHFVYLDYRYLIAEVDDENQEILHYQQMESQDFAVQYLMMLDPETIKIIFDYLELFEELSKSDAQDGFSPLNRQNPNQSLEPGPLDQVFQGQDLFANIGKFTKNKNKPSKPNQNPTQKFQVTIRKEKEIPKAQEPKSKKSNQINLFNFSPISISHENKESQDNNKNSPLNVTFEQFVALMEKEKQKRNDFKKSEQKSDNQSQQSKKSQFDAILGRKADVKSENYLKPFVGELSQKQDIREKEFLAQVNNSGNPFKNTAGIPTETKVIKQKQESQRQRKNPFQSSNQTQNQSNNPFVSRNLTLFDRLGNEKSVAQKRVNQTIGQSETSITKNQMIPNATPNFKQSSNFSPIVPFSDENNVSTSLALILNTNQTLNSPPIVSNQHQLNFANKLQSTNNPLLSQHQNASQNPFHKSLQNKVLPSPLRGNVEGVEKNVSSPQTPKFGSSDTNVSTSNISNTNKNASNISNPFFSNSPNPFSTSVGSTVKFQSSGTTNQIPHKFETTRFENSNGLQLSSSSTKFGSLGIHPIKQDNVMPHTQFQPSPQKIQNIKIESQNSQTFIIPLSQNNGIQGQNSILTPFSKNNYNLNAQIPPASTTTTFQINLPSNFNSPTILHQKNQLSAFTSNQLQKIDQVNQFARNSSVMSPQKQTVGEKKDSGIKKRKTNESNAKNSGCNLSNIYSEQHFMKMKVSEFIGKFCPEQMGSIYKDLFQRLLFSSIMNILDTSTEIQLHFKIEYLNKLSPDISRSKKQQKVRCIQKKSQYFEEGNKPSENKFIPADPFSQMDAIQKNLQQVFKSSKTSDESQKVFNMSNQLLNQHDNFEIDIQNEFIQVEKIQDEIEKKLEEFDQKLGSETLGEHSIETSKIYFNLNQELVSMMNSIKNTEKWLIQNDLCSVPKSCLHQNGNLTHEDQLKLQNRADNESEDFKMFKIIYANLDFIEANLSVMQNTLSSIK